MAEEVYTKEANTGYSWENKTGYPICNVTVNGKEYYDDKVLETVGQAVVSVFTLPTVLAMLCCSCILSTTFMIVARNSHKKSQTYTTWVVIAYIIALCCLSTFVLNLYSLYKIKKSLNMIPENPDRRPCVTSDERIVY